MDLRHESGPTRRTAAPRHGEVDADARAREQAVPSVSAVSGPASRDTTATSGAERRVVGGIDSDREGGRFRVRLFVLLMAQAYDARRTGGGGCGAGAYRARPS